MSKFRAILFLLISVAVLRVAAADPMATNYSYDECKGSLMPYPTDVKPQTVPDSLTPVMINHVGRHGARFPASAKYCNTLHEGLDAAAKQNTLTPLGKRLLEITDLTIRLSEGRWGALDSLGEYEQRLIASRMYSNFKPAFSSGNVHAISSYSPRCMMSMYCFTHQLDRLDNKLDFVTSTGRVNSPLMRPFDTDPEYKEFIGSGVAAKVYDEYFKNVCPTSAILRALGSNFKADDDDQLRDYAICEYYVLAGLSAMSVEVSLKEFFTVAEINALWSCFNMRQYLNRTATTLSTVPADICAMLLNDLISTTDRFISGETSTSVYLRFGHAETLMPLLSLMHLRGCYYMTNYFDTVAKNWCDFHVVPMAANIQLILLKHNTSGKHYLRVDLNGQPVPLLPGSDAVYISWEAARNYLTRCLPLAMR